MLGGKSLFPTASAVPSIRVQNYHVTKHADNQLVIGGIALASSAIALQYVLNAYSAYQAKQPEKSEGEEAADESAAKATTEDASAAKRDRKQNTTNTNAEASPFASWFAKNFYDGGFEEKMSKREAALILGVRESATVERIKDAHRRILIRNHPDRGGSAHLAAKINEAKDLLLKGKQ